MASVTFTPTAIPSGDKLSESIVSGDFDNDGTLDLVTANYSTVSFYKGLGNRTYAAPVNTTINNVTIASAMAADFNGDGKLDVAILNHAGGFVILLGNGDGTFTQGAKVTQASPSGTMAVADFNGDHIPDIVVNSCPAPGGGCGLLVYLGVGDGTFTQSATLSEGDSVVVTGDFNADGHQDIAAANSNSVAVYFGQGNGQFQAPLTVNQAGAVSLAVGDFYNNRIQSLAVLNIVANSSTSETLSIDTVRYVNGKLLSSAPQSITTEGFFPGVGIAAGDIDGDFRDDVFIAGSFTGTTSDVTPYSAYMLGNGDGTFAPPQDAPTYNHYEGSPFVRDLDGDSRHDAGIDWSDVYPNGGGALVLMNTNAATHCQPPGANRLSVRICTPGDGENIGGTFTFEASGNAFNGIVKRMELWIDGKKVGQNLEDQLNVTAILTRGSHTASVIAVDTFDNQASQSITFTSSGGGTCPAPSSSGVNVCSPMPNATVSSPVNFVAAGTGASGKVDHLELWIDNQKIGNYPGAEMNVNVPVSAGSHQATIVEVDSNYNFVKSTPVDFSVTSGGSCAPPSSPGVNVCSPQPNQNVASPVSFAAAGTAANGKVDHLELWIDGQKIGNYSGAQMNASVPLTAGSHQATVVEVDSNYNFIKSAPVNFVVTSGGSCAPPSSPGVNVCSPTQNETTSSPVNFIAAGTGASGSVDHLELWVDGQKIGNYSGNQMNTKVSVPSGTHQATVVEVDSTFHYIKSTPINFTVN